MAKNIYDPAIYNDLVARTNHPPPSQVTASTFISEAGYRCVRPRGANSWLLFATLNGKGLFQQKDLQHYSLGNSVTLLGPTAYSDYGVPIDRQEDERKKHASHGMITQERKPILPKAPYWHFHWVHFQFSENWFRWFNMPDIGKGLFHIEDVDPDIMKRIDFLFWELRSSLSDQDSLSDAIVQNTLERILLLISQCRKQQQHPIDTRISTTISYLNENYHKQHSIEELAKMARLSESRFAHLFKEQTGDSVIQYIKTIRIKHAQELLSTTQLTLGQIAQEVGFESSFYFSNQFKREMGISPKFFRQQRLATR